MNRSVPVGAGGDETRRGSRAAAAPLSRVAALAVICAFIGVVASSACSATSEDDGFESTQSPSGAGQGGSGGESSGVGLYLANLAAAVVGWQLTLDYAGGGEAVFALEEV